MAKVSLAHTSNRDYHPGKPLWYRILWLVVEALTLLNPDVPVLRAQAPCPHRFRGADR